MSDKNATPQLGPAPDSGEMGKEKKKTPLTMEEMKEMHIGAGRVQLPEGAEKNTPKPSQEADWVMKAGEKIGKGLETIGKGVKTLGKGISNAMDTAGSAVESAENFLNDCACKVSSWDWGCFDFLLNGARGYSGEGGGFSRNKFWGAVKKGTHNFVFGTVKGVLNMVGHPVETAKGIGHAVTHPKELLNGLKEQYWGSRKNWTEKVSGVTEAICDIAFLAYEAQKGFDKLSKGSKARKAAKIAESEETAGEAVKAGEAGEIAEEAVKAGEVEEEAAKAGGKGKVKIESISKAIDKLISDLKSGKVKLHDLSSDEQLKVAQALKKKAPLKTNGDVEIIIREKNGYDDILYKWNANGYQYEMRWHTATPNWRVDRKKPGFSGGKDPITGQKLQGYPAIKEVLIWPANGKPYYVPRKVWEDAGRAYRKGIATQEQLDMLRFGHYIQE